MAGEWPSRCCDKKPDNTEKFPRGDFGMLERMYSGNNLTEPPHGFAKVDFAGLGLPTREEYVAAYCRRMGRGDIEHWNYYVAFSLFRLAAIAQGVYRRGLAGNSSNPESIKMSRAPRERADIAWSLVA